MRRCPLALPAAAVLAASGLVQPASLAGLALALTSATLGTFGGAILAMATGALILCAWLALGPHGGKRLGPATAQPEFRMLSWIAMLFAAGMGTGLVVWGAAEPATHALAPPGGGGLSPASMRQAMVLTFLSWGPHAWAIYGGRRWCLRGSRSAGAVR